MKSDRSSQVILASLKPGAMGVVILDAVVQSGNVAAALALKHLKYLSGPVKLFRRGSTMLSLQSPLAGSDVGPIIVSFVTPFPMLTCSRVGCLLRKEDTIELSMNCVSNVKEWRFENVGAGWEAAHGWFDSRMEVRSRVG